MEYLVLNDGSKIQMEAGSGLSNLMVVSESREAMAGVWELLTEENLKKIRIENSGEAVIGEYADFVLENETSVVREDGTVLTCFALRQKTELELLQEQTKEQAKVIEQQSENIDMLTACVLEMSEQVYA